MGPLRPDPTTAMAASRGLVPWLITHIWAVSELIPRLPGGRPVLQVPEEVLRGEELVQRHLPGAVGVDPREERRERALVHPQAPHLPQPLAQLRRVELAAPVRVDRLEPRQRLAERGPPPQLRAAEDARRVEGERAEEHHPAPGVD
eukprot:gene3274-biopygen3115